MPFLAPIFGWFQSKALWLVGIGLAVLAGLALLLRMQAKAEQAGRLKERASNAAAAVKRTTESRKARDDVEARVRTADPDARADLMRKWTRPGGQ